MNSWLALVEWLNNLFYWTIARLSFTLLKKLCFKIKHSNPLNFLINVSWVRSNKTNMEVTLMEDDFKHLVRISRKDVDGNKKIEQALTEIKGVGLSLSRSICLTLGLNLEEN